LAFTDADDDGVDVADADDAAGWLSDDLGADAVALQLVNASNVTANIPQVFPMGSSNHAAALAHGSVRG
jgi:hypothetical protein